MTAEFEIEYEFCSRQRSKEALEVGTPLGLRVDESIVEVQLENRGHKVPQTRTNKYERSIWLPGTTQIILNVKIYTKGGNNNHNENINMLYWSFRRS